MVELLPCPHCEAPARFVWGPRDHGFVKCTRPSCGARSGDFAHQINPIAAWNARATSTPSATVREWVLVPREPTEAMCEAGESSAIIDWSGAHIDPKDCWSAMIAASPTPDRAKEMDRG